MHKVENSIPITSQSPSEMQVGDVAIITFDKGLYTGKHLVRIYTGFMLLENPSATWTGPGDMLKNDMKVKILPPGSKVTITLKGEMRSVKGEP